MKQILTCKINAQLKCPRRVKAFKCTMFPSESLWNRNVKWRIMEILNVHELY